MPDCAGAALRRLFVYYLGVVKALKAAGLHRNAYLIASSGGASAQAHLPQSQCCSDERRAVAGCTLFFDVDLDAMVEYVLGCAAQARLTLGGAFRLREYVAGAIERFADPRVTPALLHGNMEVSVTRLPSLRNLRVRDFSSWDAMRSHLLATSCIVPLAGLPMRLPGTGWVLDGGLSDLQLVRGWRRSGSFCKVHEAWGPAPRVVPPLPPPAAVAPPAPVAITACPFYMSRAAIKPDVLVNPLWAFYPPEPAALYQLFLMGQRNTQSWLDAQAAAAAASPQPPPTAPPPHGGHHRWAEYASAARAAAVAAAAQQAEACGAYAKGCGAYAKGVAAEATRYANERRGSLRRTRERLVMAFCCALVYCELLAQAAASALAAALPCGVPRARAWERAKSFARPLPGLASLALTAPHSPAAARLLASHAVVLSQLSLLYRLFAFVMV